MLVEVEEGRKLRAAVFGFGRMGLQHARSIQIEKFGEIVGIADLQEEFKLRERDSDF